MFGQMTAGSWIYIGTQGILQGTYQTFAAAGEKHFGSPNLAGRTILTAGLGGMGGAQPLAATMAGAAILCVEVDPLAIERRLETRYLDEASESLDDALARVRAAAAEGRALSVGLLGNAAEVVPELAARGEHFDLVTDQTAAHDPLNGYVPVGLGVEEAAALRETRSRGVPPAGQLVDRAPRRGAARVRPRRQLCFRLWQQPERRGARGRSRGGLLIPGLRPGLYPAAVLSRRSGRSGGRRSRAIRRTSPRSTGRSWSCSPTTRRCSAGSRWRRSASRSRASRLGSAGSATATVPAPDWRSTSSSATARSRRRS